LLDSLLQERGETLVGFKSNVVGVRENEREEDGVLQM